VLRRADQFLGANNLDYQSETGRYVAEGAVRYQDSGMRMVADRAEGDQNTDTHNIQNVRYQLISRRGNGGAEHIEMQGAQGALYGATYSTCPPTIATGSCARSASTSIPTKVPAWPAMPCAARRATFRCSTCRGFPFPIDNRRRSGLLSPSIGLSGRNGFDYRQPYYFNLAPNYDATLIPRLMTDRGLQLGGEFRYLTETGRGVFFGTYLPNDKTHRSRAPGRDR
jgi:LPS-assembly protein